MKSPVSWRWCGSRAPGFVANARVPADFVKAVLRRDAPDRFVDDLARLRRVRMSRPAYHPARFISTALPPYAPSINDAFDRQ